VLKVYKILISFSFQFHKNQNFEKFCTQSFVKRCAFTIADLCATDLNITLVPGQHVPIRADVDNLYVVGSDFSDTRSFITCTNIDETNTILTDITSPVRTRKVYESDTDNLSNFTSVSQRPPQTKKLFRHKVNPWRMESMVRDLASTEASEDEGETVPLTRAALFEDQLNCTNPFRREIYEKASLSRISNQTYDAAELDDEKKEYKVFDRSYHVSRQPIATSMNWSMPAQGECLSFESFLQLFPTF
jgi:hypothetical protein